MAKAYDVAVVGAGPAGATAARIIATQGHRTIVIERRTRIGIPVQCGELIPTPSEVRNLFPRSKKMPAAVHVPQKFITNKTHFIRLISPNGSAYEFPFEANIVDRSRFDSHLADLADKAGAEILLCSTVTKRNSDNELTIKSKHENVTIGPRLVVGADGANSTIARSLSSQFMHLKKDLSPSLQYVMSNADVDSSVIEMYFGGAIAPGGYTWVIPKGAGLVNVGFGMRRNLAHDNTPLRAYLERFVSKILAPSLKNAVIERRIGAIIPVGGPLKKTWSNGVLLIGDAAGHVMASNGGGIPAALCGGAIAGDVISNHLKNEFPLSKYEEQWRAEFGRELETAVRVLRIADTVMTSDTITDVCMSLAGVRFLEPLIRCRLPLPVDLASKTIVKFMKQVY